MYPIFVVILGLLLALQVVWFRRVVGGCAKVCLNASFMGEFDGTTCY